MQLMAMACIHNSDVRANFGQNSIRNSAHVCAHAPPQPTENEKKSILFGTMLELGLHIKYTH